VVHGLGDTVFRPDPLAEGGRTRANPSVVQRSSQRRCEAPVVPAPPWCTMAATRLKSHPWGAASIVSTVSSSREAARPPQPESRTARAETRGEWREGVSAEQVIHTLVGAILHRALLEHAPMTRRWLEGAVDIVLLGVVPRAESTS